MRGASKQLLVKRNVGKGDKYTAGNSKRDLPQAREGYDNDSSKQTSPMEGAWETSEQLWPTA